MYQPSLLPPELRVIVDINPLFYFIEALLRAPLLGLAPPVTVYAVLAALAVVGWAATFRFFQMVRPRVPYWV
jgi:ABC-type polysaccharide/polyol phosphate export permease